MKANLVGHGRSYTDVLLQYLINSQKLFRSFMIHARVILIFVRQ